MMENISLGIMGKEQIAIVFKTRDKFFQAPPGRSSMEKARIFVPVKCNP